jgi:hypothetical protein
VVNSTIQRPGQDGFRNTGGGGGGAGAEVDANPLIGSGAGTGGHGGDGVVIFRIPTARFTGKVSGNHVLSTDGEYTVLKFTGAGKSFDSPFPGPGKPSELWPERLTADVQDPESVGSFLG